MYTVYHVVYREIYRENIYKASAFVEFFTLSSKNEIYSLFFFYFSHGYDASGFNYYKHVVGLK